MIIKTLCTGLLLISCLSISHFSNAAPLRLVIPQFPPYTSELDGHYSGIGIDLIKKVMQKVKVDYQLRPTPNYARALEELIRGQADGFFLASENLQRNSVAVFSEPLLINRWSWFLPPGYILDPSDARFKASAKIATIHGSNTNRWLIKHNFNITTKANSASTFATLLLEKKRIDAVFIASIVFRKTLTSQGYFAKDYVEVVQEARPFGIYISKAYLEKHPGFMDKLNSAIVKIQDLN